MEDDDIRPIDEEAIKKIAKREEYGHDKLKCEEYLRSHSSSNDYMSFPFVVLRLPDVIGPYDSTSRLWAYIRWL
jgi:nucleoside-diphosphate-sugar epimerase